MKPWKITCKNCGKVCTTKIPGAELCSIPCILEWREEEEYARNNPRKKVSNLFQNKSEVK